MISSDHLEPGEIGRVKMTVATANLTGRVAKHITIYSNDPIKPQLSVEATLDVTPDTVVPK